MVLFDYVPLFLYFLISLIKPLIGLKIFYRQRAVGGHGVGEGPQVLCCFNMRDLGKMQNKLFSQDLQFSGRDGFFMSAVVTNCDNCVKEASNV